MKGHTNLVVCVCVYVCMLYVNEDSVSQTLYWSVLSQYCLYM